MVKKLIYIIIYLLALLPAAHAKQKIILVLDKTEVQLGHHIKAELYGVGLHNKLINIDLAILRENFGVNIVETSEEVEDDRWPGQAVQSMQFQLFPRSVGSYVIPKLVFDGLSSSAKNISVVQGINKTRTGDTNIYSKVRISSNSSWEREQVLVEVEIRTTDKYASLRSDELTIPGFEVYSLPTKNVKHNQNGINYSILKISWALFPLVPGQHTVELPAIEYHKYGKKIRTYYLPKKELTVKALPTYIPPTMPVGKISISSQLRTKGLLYPDALYYWDISLTSFKTSPNWVPQVMSQISSNRDIQFFSKNTSQNLNTDHGRLSHQVTHHIPFKPLTNGEINMPAIRLQYFDADSGKIVTTIHNPESIFILSFIWRIIIIILFTTFSIVVAIFFHKKISSLIQHKRLCNATLIEIEEAKSFSDLRGTLHNISIMEGWSDNLTIRDWTLVCSSHIKNNHSMEKLTNKLSQACYSKNQSTELRVLRKNLLDYVRSKKL